MRKQFVASAHDAVEELKRQIQFMSGVDLDARTAYFTDKRAQSALWCAGRGVVTRHFVRVDDLLDVIHT
jgi:hypothetical protein